VTIIIPEGNVPNTTAISREERRRIGLNRNNTPPSPPNTPLERKAEMLPPLSTEKARGERARGEYI